MAALSQRAAQADGQPKQLCGWLERPQPDSRQAVRTGSEEEGDAEQPTTPTRESAASGAVNSGSYSSSDYDDEEAPLLSAPQLRFAHASLARRADAQQRRATVQAFAVVAACVAWTLVSSAAILINKHIMVELSFHFPATVAALGMLGTTVASFLACAVFRVVPCKASITPHFYVTRLLTTGFFMALSFQAGNTAYLYLSVAFVQMLKAFTPVSTMLCGFAFRLEQPTVKLIAAVGCICCGVLVSSYGELNFSVFGVLAMLTSISAEGLRTVMMQHLLAAKQFHPLEAWMYLGPACTAWLVLLIGICEGHHILEQHALNIVAAHPWYFGFAALAGFAVNALAMLVIKLASALTLKVLGICKDIGLVLFGVLLLGEHVAGLQVLGYSVSLAGFAYYNWVKVMLSGIVSPEPLPPRRSPDALKADVKAGSGKLAQAQALLFGAASGAGSAGGGAKRSGFIGTCLAEPLLPPADTPLDKRL